MTRGNFLFFCKKALMWFAQVYSRFSQTHKIGNIGTIANCVYPSICSYFFILLYDVGKCKFRDQWAQEDCILRFQTSLVYFISNGIAYIKFAILKLYCDVVPKLIRLL